MTPNSKSLRLRFLNSRHFSKSHSSRGVYKLALLGFSLSTHDLIDAYAKPSSCPSCTHGVAPPSSLVNFKRLHQQQALQPNIPTLPSPVVSCYRPHASSSTPSEKEPSSRFACPPLALNKARIAKPDALSIHYCTVPHTIAPANLCMLPRFRCLKSHMRLKAHRYQHAIETSQVLARHVNVTAQCCGAKVGSCRGRTVRIFPLGTCMDCTTVRSVELMTVCVSMSHNYCIY